MTEKEIQLLGFQRNDDHGIECTDQDNNTWVEDAFYYYTYTVAQGLEFISNSDDEVGEDGEWYVEFFDTNPAVRFYDFAETQALINKLDKHVVNDSKGVDSTTK